MFTYNAAASYMFENCGGQFSIALGTKFYPAATCGHGQAKEVELT